MMNIGNNKKLLIIIDVQKGFINKHTKHIPTLVEKLQNNYEHVIITRFINRKNSPFQTILHRNNFSKNSGEKELAFKPNKNAIIIDKYRYSCVNQKIIKYIKNNNIECVNLCGIETDACILKSSLDFFEQNINQNVLTKYCGSMSGKKRHTEAINILNHVIGKNQII